MRILFISHFIPHPPTGGASLRNFNIVKELSKLNDVHLVTFTQRDRHPSRERIELSRQALKLFCREISIIELPTDLNRLRWYGLLALNVFSTEPYSAWKFRSKAMSHAIADQLARYDFDVVHVDTIALADYAQDLQGLPTVLNHHNIESTLLRRRAETLRNPVERIYMGMQAAKLRAAERRAATTFGSNVCVSAVDRDELLGIEPRGTACVVPNGTDTEFFRSHGEPAEAPTLVFAGSMGWYPNSDAMLLFASRIWPLIKRAIPGVTMHLIGSKPPQEVVRLAARDEHFKVLGFVDDVRPFIEKATVYVVPIRVGGGTRLKILDAMSMGKAIVSHPIGAEGIAVTDGEDILLASEPQAFADQVIRLLNDRALAQRLGRAARRTAEERYSWTAIVPSLESAYRSVIQRAGEDAAAFAIPSQMSSVSR